jgi:hypothetical protein
MGHRPLERQRRPRAHAVAEPPAAVQGRRDNGCPGDGPGHRTLGPQVRPAARGRPRSRDAGPRRAQEHGPCHLGGPGRGQRAHKRRPAQDNRESAPDFLNPCTTEPPHPCTMTAWIDLPLSPSAGRPPAAEGARRRAAAPGHSSQSLFGQQWTATERPLFKRSNRPGRREAAGVDGCSACAPGACRVAPLSSVLSSILGALTSGLPPPDVPLVLPGSASLGAIDETGLAGLRPIRTTRPRTGRRLPRLTGPASLPASRGPARP